MRRPDTATLVSTIGDDAASLRASPGLPTTNPHRRRGTTRARSDRRRGVAMVCTAAGLVVALSIPSICSAQDAAEKETEVVRVRRDFTVGDTFSYRIEQDIDRVTMQMTRDLQATTRLRLEVTSIAADGAVAWAGRFGRVNGTLTHGALSVGQLGAFDFDTDQDAEFDTGADAIDQQLTRETVLAGAKFEATLEPGGGWTIGSFDLRKSTLVEELPPSNGDLRESAISRARLLLSLIRPGYTGDVELDRGAWKQSLSVLDPPTVASIDLKLTPIKIDEVGLHASASGSIELAASDSVESGQVRRLLSRASVTSNVVDGRIAASLANGMTKSHELRIEHGVEVDMGRAKAALSMTQSLVIRQVQDSAEPEQAETPKESE